MANLKAVDFNDALAFVRVVDIGSFSGAAISLATSKSAISKQVSRLEHSLKTKLLNRSTRQLSLTEIGHAVYQHAVRMLEESKAIEATVAGMQAGPSGTLRVSTSMAFGNMHLAGMVPEFMERYPDIQLTLNLNDRYVDLVEEGFDVVLRLTSTLKMLSVVARPIADIRYALVASPSYIKQRGTPHRLERLSEHRCLTFGDSNTANLWNFVVKGEQLAVRVNSVLSVNSSPSLRTAMLSGAGIALLPTFVVGADIQRGDAKLILPSAQPVGQFGNQLYAVYLQNKFLPPKIRVFIDFLIEKIGPKPYWDEVRQKAQT